ncbi:hypothetical protein GCM10011414_14190 [Croceivirga lutea]|uniref:tetratricopeptide repeat protein n=1 Tax=Croceivirga lutea TaxID=1775167 RepID=UPI00163960DF|nr:tetratricopeptide repeat protein [Croceivirga lutea]GGG45762.1 hypothetical protein GCM10011414_14190 [Croceivirga lutea]
MRFILLLFLLATTSYTFTINAQAYKNLDSLKMVYQNHPPDTTKANLAGTISHNLSFTNPKESLKYIKEMIALSKKFDYLTGLSKGYNNLSFYYVNIDELDSALYYKKEALKIAKKQPNYGGILTINMGLAVLFNKKNQFEEAEKYLNENILIFQNKDSIEEAREKDFEFIGSTYHALGDINVRKGQLNLALKNQLKALELYQNRTKDELYIADAYNALGQTEMKLENLDQSLIYLKSALEVYQNFKDVLWESDVLKLIGENLVLQEKPLEAMPFLTKCIQLSKDNDFKLTGASAHIILGDAHTKLKNSDEAFVQYNNALEIYREMDNATEINAAFLSLGVLYNNTNKPLLAITNLTKSISISNAIGATLDAYNAYLERAKSFKNIGQLDKAVKDLEKSNQLQDTLYSLKKSQQIEEYRILFETEKKEAEIAIQDEEIKTLSEKSRADNLKKGLYAGGMFTFLAVSGLLFFGFRQRIKKNQIAREKQEEIYKQEIAHKQKELASQTLHLVQKNTFIQELMQNLESIKNSPEKFKMEFRRIVMLLKKENASDKDWEVFKTYFSEVHNDFDQKLRTLYPDISEKEMRLATFLKMNLTTKEIAATLNVLPDSILKSKYRFKKKIGLDKETDLVSFLNSL